MPALIGFPTELIAMIATKLHSQEFFSFRLVSREINYKSFSYFLDCYFHSRYHMLDRYSLENLLQISSHPVFGPALRILEICVDHLKDEPPHFKPCRLERPRKYEVATVNEGEYRRYLDDQAYLGKSGLDTAYLTQAFVNLSNCKTIVVSDVHQPWGAASQERRTGVFPTSEILMPDSITFVKRALRVILAAVFASRLPLEEFNISFGFNRFALRPSMLPLPELCSNQLRARLTSVSTLLLRLNPRSGESAELWARHLIGFITLFPALERLGLSFYPDDYPRDEIRRFRAICEALRLQRLRVLEVECVECNEDDLAKLILSHKDTLKEISFKAVSIVAGGGTWQSLIRMIRDQLSVGKLTMVCKLARKAVVAGNGDGVTIPSSIEVSGDWQALTEVIESIEVQGADSKYASQLGETVFHLYTGPEAEGLE